MIFKQNKLFLSNFLIFFSSLFIVNTISFIAYACPVGNARSLAYIRRDDNRCEGLRDRNISSRFELIAFSTGEVNNYSNILKIRVPGTTTKIQPIIKLQSLFRNYLLDQFQSMDHSSEFTFDLKTNPVLQRANIPANSLLPLAFIEQNSKRNYYPVILDKASDSYKIVIYTPEYRTFPKVEIRQNGKLIPSNLKPRNIADNGAIVFYWEAKNTPPGTYNFYLEDGDGKSLSFSLKHNPNWLK